MPLYRIEYWRSCTGYCYVEADSELDAVRIFDEEGLEDNDNPEDGDEIRIDSITLEPEREAGKTA